MATLCASVLASVFLITAAPAKACPAATKFIEKVGRSGVSALASGSRSRFHSIFTRYADVHAIARFALGKYVRQINAREKREYYRLATNYVVNTLLGGLSGLAADRVEIKNCRDARSYADVQSDLVMKDGTRYPVKWRVRRHRVIDMNVFGVWLAIKHRTDFSNIINQAGGDVNALLRHLRNGKSG